MLNTIFAYYYKFYITIDCFFMVFRHLIPLTYGNFPIVYKNEYRAGHVLYEHSL